MPMTMDDKVPSKWVNGVMVGMTLAEKQEFIKAENAREQELIDAENAHKQELIDAENARALLPPPPPSLQEQLDAEKARLTRLEKALISNEAIIASDIEPETD